MNEPNILLIGAGWLGLPLSIRLKSDGYKVIATKTSSEGLELLDEHQIQGAVCDLNDRSLEGLAAIEELIKTNMIDVIIGAFPPGFRQGRGEDYSEQWQQLVEVAKASDVKKIIMVSSTTVYPDKAEIMNEDMASLPIAINSEHFSDKAKIMLQAEEHVRSSTLDYCIVRCSGLIGPNRHPSRFAAKLSAVSDQAAANMLHLDDAIGAMMFATTTLNNCIVNATTPSTCDKATFYRAALRAAGLDSSLPNVVSKPDKVISSEKLQSLGYHFKFQHTLDAL